MERDVCYRKLRNRGINVGKLKIKNGKDSEMICKSTRHKVHLGFSYTIYIYTQRHMYIRLLIMGVLHCCGAKIVGRY